MGRRVRCVFASQLLEVTCRTIQGRFLLKPGDGFDEIFVGILARAAERYGVPVHAYACLSNHYHLLISPDSVEALAGFMRYVNTNLSKEAGRRNRWRGPLFKRRYQAIPIADEAAAQISRLRYLLEQGCKEGLVARPTDWPGAHAARPLLRGENASGLWMDRTREYEARRSGRSPRLEEVVVSAELELTPLPCWQNKASEWRRGRISELLADIEEETAGCHARAGTSPAGVKSVLRLDPHSRPAEQKRTPAPLVHAVTNEMRQQLTKAYDQFLLAYRAASKRWRSGDLSVTFPEGSFAPLVSPAILAKARASPT